MPAPRGSRPAAASADSITVCRKAIFWWVPILYLLISSAFYLRTYDSAQVKITLVQMGGLCLLALWLCRLVEEGELAFSKDDLVCLAPFLAYYGYGILSFLHAPYHWSSTDFFLRRIFYMTVALIVIQEFTHAAIARLTRMLIWAAWISAGYGVVQWFDYRFFPPGIGQGIDPFIWRGAFGDRVFSTYGNPNFFADYLVIMLPVIVCQYFKTRRLRLLVLLAMDFFDLAGAQTKGAWIGCAISLILLLGTYFYFLEHEKLRRYRLQIGGVMAGLLCSTLVAVGLKLRGSFTSVNFRLFTWEATWEMIMTQPAFGTGIGSFWVIYPAFRRPPIFHIEGKHNTETDHSEDEYLEVLFDEGIAGFGIFLWLILSTCVVAYRALGQLTGGLKMGERAPPRVFDLMGYLVAFQGMLAHNCFDVSLRFVSSGVYLGLLSGLVVNLSRGIALSELHSMRDAGPGPGIADAAEPSGRENLSKLLLWPARLAALASLALTASHLWTGAPAGLPAWLVRLGFPRFSTQGFNELQGAYYQMRMAGESLQWCVAWACFGACVIFLAVVFARIILLTRKPLVPLIIFLMLKPLDLVWGFFCADVNHNIAIFFSKQQNWDQALKHYFIVGDYNPAFVMSFYFKGNVFNDRFNMAKVYNPNWGDKDGVARDDFERASAAYEEVRLRAPNYVQMHHQVGVLWMKYGDWLLQQGRNDEGQKAWDTALASFEKYRKIDPVFPPNYYRMGHIYVMRKQYDKAVETYRALIDARQCGVAPKLADRDWTRKTILAYQQYVKEDGRWVHRHETSEAYTNLANAYFMKGDLAAAEAAYRRALAMDPVNQNAQRNLQLLYQKARQMGRPGGFPVVMPPGPAGTAPRGGPYAPSVPLLPGIPQAPPSFELIPSKH